MVASVLGILCLYMLAGYTCLAARQPEPMDVSAIPESRPTPEAVSLPVTAVPEVVPLEPEESESIAQDDAVDPLRVTELLVDAIIQVESGGNPKCVGRAGERGLMQIKRLTWKQMSRELFGSVIGFDYAFNPVINRKVGKAYLAHLHEMLIRYRSHWRSDERALLLAAYNAGPERVIQAGFDIRNLPQSTRVYIECATALHDYYLAEDAPAIQEMLMSRTITRKTREPAS